jgi:hypothetical protein
MGKIGESMPICSAVVLLLLLLLLLAGLALMLKA